MSFGSEQLCEVGKGIAFSWSTYEKGYLHVRYVAIPKWSSLCYLLPFVWGIHCLWHGRVCPCVAMPTHTQ